ncbi:MAG: hypothetical protein E7071_08590 [Bacteroidales bacterium]|nr:hypothetical protein [Bacteroidales bacterium]
MKKIILMALSIATIVMPIMACSSDNAEPVPTPNPPVEPTPTQEPTQEPTPTPEPTVPVFPTPALPADTGKYIAINEDIVIRCLTAEDSTAAVASVTKLQGYMETLKNTLPAEAYAKLVPDTISYNPEAKGLEYITKEQNATLNGIILGSTLKPFSDSLARENQPIVIANLYAQKYFYEILTEEDRAEIENHHKSVKNKYNKVYYINRRSKLVRNIQSDAVNSPVEYFGEITEAYLGINNFYPFDIEELQRHDKTGFELAKKAWGEVEIPVNEYGITLPPETLTQWLQYKESPLDPYYRKYIDANGMPIVASRFVSDSALLQAKEIVIAMLVDCPEAQEWMLKDHFRIGIIGYRENVTDMPECRIMPEIWPDTDWDARGRGYGATAYIPLMSCGEENIVKIPNYKERYPTESIMVHEFAHNVEYGLRKYHTEFCNALDAAFKNAEENNLWVDAAGRKTYSRDNVSEYFAEGVQAWFNTCRMVVAINGKNTTLKYRDQLKEYDPMLYEAIDMVMPNYYLTGYHFDYE